MIWITDNIVKTRANVEGDKWVPARPINYTVRTLWQRFREAWLVFTGKCDCARWIRQ